MPQNEKRNGTGVKTFIASCLIVFAIWVAYALFFPLFVPEFEDRGIAGDLFGGFTALFSALAFAGLIYTLLIQKEELSLQREELKRLADEQSSSSESLKKQLAELARTRNQTTFFQLLDEFRNTKMSISRAAGRANETFTGSRAIQHLLHNKILSSTTAVDQQSLQADFNDIFNGLERDFAPYLRVFYVLLGFISKSEEDLQPFYSDLLTSQLTNIELILIMMHGASDFGSEKNDLIKRLEVLRNLDLSKYFEEDCFSLTHYKSVYGEKFIMPKAS